MARPEIGVVTNVGYAHVEFFDSIEGIAAAKRELIEGLPRDGVAVLNADDARVRGFRDAHPGRSVTFGFSEMRTCGRKARRAAPGRGFAPWASISRPAWRAATR
jgi:UDP-N-acetylmuramyl pentapeptide synthase